MKNTETNLQFDREILHRAVVEFITNKQNL
jgi:hypothetical protein